MSLSDREKQILAEMEEHLRADDTSDASYDELAREHDMRNGGLSSDSYRGQTSWAPRIIGSAIMLIVCGIILLVAGMSVFSHIMVVGILLAILGFICMLTAVTLPFNSRAHRLLGVKPAMKNKNEHGQSFMERQQAMWERRNRQ